MNYRMIFYMTGRLLQLEAALLLLPALVALGYGDGGLVALLLSAAVALVAVAGFTVLNCPTKKVSAML